MTGRDDPRSNCEDASRTVSPVVLGAIGLGAGLLWVVVAGALGVNVKQPFFLGVQLALIIVITVLAVATVVWATVLAVRRHKSGLVASWLLAGVILLLTWGVLFPTHRMMLREIVRVREIAAQRHGGPMPPN